VAETDDEEPTEEGPAPPFRAVEPGKAYAIDDLIFRMVVNGDERAFAALLENLPAERLDRVFRDLYTDYAPGRIDESVTLSGYAPFFRVLYNASYLERDASERALDYLARPANRAGIAAGVPKTVEVAGSFGHGTIPAAGGAEEELVHEIGIVYHPGRPYLLGIIARGGDRQALEALLRDVSHLVYREVDQETK
jgi:beta-lactamase class A